MNPACKQLETQLTDFVDGHADSKTRGVVQAHLDTCAHCHRRVESQTAVRHQLRLLAKRGVTVTPPAHLWERAAAAWDTRDAQKQQIGKFRWMLAGTCLMLFLLTAVWARLATSHEFPIEAVMRDYRTMLVASPMPHYVTTDPDKAARWLRTQLDADVPPVNLSLSRAELLGADVVATPERHIGRLLYRTSHGLAAVYLCPGGTHFAQSTPQPFENQTFQVKNSADVGMFGWEVNSVGYGLLLAQPLGAGRALAVNAARASEETEQ